MSSQERAISALHSREWIDSDDLYYLLKDVLALRFSAASPVVVIDPIVTTMLIDSPKVTAATLRECRRQFKEAIDSDALILVPLHWGNHWSLLAYKPGFTQWYCCDSMGAYHRQRTVACLDALDRLKMIASGAGQRIFFYDDMPRQPLSYECARYVLFYAFVLLSAHIDAEASGDATEYAKRLERDLPLVNEENRVSFEERLLTMIS